MTPESKAKSEVTKSLAALKTAGDVIWHTRLQSGMFSVDGNFCHASEEGTFDLVALFRDKVGNLAIAFIEVKRSDKPAKFSPSQIKFRDKYYGLHKNVYFWLVQSGIQVERLILNHCYNRVEAIEFKL